MSKALQQMKKDWDVTVAISDWSRLYRLCVATGDVDGAEEAKTEIEALKNYSNTAFESSIETFVLAMVGIDK